MAEADSAPTRLLGDLVGRWRNEERLVDLLGPEGGGDWDPAATEIELSNVRDDSRTVEPGDLFVAVRGLRVDGHDFVGEAADRGAAVVAVERPIPGLSVPQLVVDGGAAALASAAAWWYDDPSRELLTVGVTGTNGKTTTSFLAQAALEATGMRTGLIGTVGIRIGDELRRNEEPNTTPGALVLQRLLREMRDAGEDAVVIETSSHGLAADRVASVAYDAAIFTNLSHEHLDFHGTFEAYRDAKVRLFSRLPREAKGGRPGLAVINVDDEHAPVFVYAAQAAGASVVTYGVDPGAGLELVDVQADAAGSRFAVEIGGYPPVGVRLPIAGRFNAHNALAVLGMAVGWDLDLQAVVDAFERFPGVPGRMEVIARGQPFHVVIDYAHTPGSIEAAARELAELVRPGRGSVISVFGASGERDVGKRPLMGEAAARHSRVVIVTEDDSRGEDPAAIYEAIARGAEAAGKQRGDDLFVIGDRRQAIAEAFRRAARDDVVFLAGKGHETWNVGPDGPQPWSDREAAESALNDLGYEGQPGGSTSS
jgi:UDP-N-acetylmuramoyl-L-alanyl-D-glutamate--2,6-diaminopimelate ligase